MSSRTNPSKPKAVKGRRTLRRMRGEAGYRSAKDFAEQAGIPVSTYARYERAGDGPECGIPLPSAWAIADALGCSIDLVGREDIDVAADSIQERVEALSRAGREMHNDYLRFLEFREEASASQNWTR